MTPALELQDVTVQIGKETILESVTFSLLERQSLGIIGPNGAGKSVLLETLLGLHEPISGSVRIFGRSPEDSRGEVGYVPQFAHFESDFPISVRDVVLTGRLHQTKWMRGYSRSDREIANDAMSRMRISDLAGRPMFGLSGGQKQRVLIARALAVQARLMLLDEPTASLDTSTADGLYELLEELRKDCAIVLVTHDMSVVSRYLDCVACLRRKLIHYGDPKVSPEVLQQMYGHHAT